ncbi:MAG TPA: acyl-CoA dehydrogenase family protein [Steroidobacteraceae bacterium]
MSLDVWQRAEQLRAEIREFVLTTMPSDILRKSSRHLMLSKDEYVRWMQALQSRGWAVGHWPREYGGLGWSTLERFVFEDELGRAGCPWVIPFGVKYVGPVIYTFGSEAQKQRFLPPIVSAAEWWAQGYSEPGAGSDLASLRTSATRDGDYYIVNGQKAWTTYAQWADWMFCLVRTSRGERPQEGISFLLIDMRSAGVSVKPVRSMDMCHHVNEVWLENVRVPAANRIGAEGDGWALAKFLLVNERTYGSGLGESRFALERLEVLAAEQHDAALRARVVELDLRLLALECVSYQTLADMMAGVETGGEASLLKVRASEMYQDILEATVDALGYAGVAFDAETLHGEGPPPMGPDDAGGVLRYHLYNRAATIYGGSTEIQRNIIAKSVLGL